MAKKDSIPLTPEELAAKKARKSEKRKLFGDTFFKALAVMLAIVFVYSVVYVAFGQGMTVIQKVNSTGVVASGSGSVSGSVSGSGSGSASSVGSTDSSNSAGSATNDPASNSSGSGTASSGSSTGAMDEAAVANLINTATGKAVSSKAGYDWERHCTVNDIDVGSATNVLNKIIHGVDENADLNSVVGGFLGRGDRNVKVPKGKTLAELTEEKDDGTTKPYYHGNSYTLKATKLQAGDIKNLKINGDTYTFDIPDTVNPGRDDATPLSRFTNDIVVKDEVNKEIQEQVGSAVTVNTLDAKYTNIKVSVTIKDGKLVELTYSFRGDAALGLKAAVVNINGTGNLIANAKYSNFVY